MIDEDLINPKTEYSKIASIVDQLIDDLNLTQHYFDKLLNWALWGFSELKLDQAQEVKTIRKTISDVKTVTLPVDYVDWSKIGVPVGQYIKTLSINGELSKEERTLGNPAITQQWPLESLPNGIDFSSYGGYVFANYNNSTLFGIGGGLPSQGLFQVVDRGDGLSEVLLDYPVTATELIIEYISDGIDPCGETVVHAYLRDYVRTYVIHQWERLRPARERSEAAIDRTSRELSDAERKVRQRQNRITPQDMINISRRFYKLTPHV